MRVDTTGTDSLEHTRVFKYDTVVYDDGDLRVEVALLTSKTVEVIISEPTLSEERSYKTYYFHRKSFFKWVKLLLRKLQ